jgi:hypothetical protein
MKRRATNVIRVLDRCARCGMRPDLYSVRKVVAFLPHRHELIVCTIYCDALTAELHGKGKPDEPRAMELQAMSIDATNPIDAMAFAERWRADARRVQRTAEYFLGADVYAALVPQLRAKHEEEREYLEAARYRSTFGLDDDEDDDLPF